MFAFCLPQAFRLSSIHSVSSGQKNNVKPKVRDNPGGQGSRTSLPISFPSREKMELQRKYFQQAGNRFKRLTWLEKKFNNITLRGG